MEEHFFFKVEQHHPYGEKELFISCWHSRDGVPVHGHTIPLRNIEMEMDSLVGRGGELDGNNNWDNIQCLKLWDLHMNTTENWLYLCEILQRRLRTRTNKTLQQLTIWGLFTTTSARDNQLDEKLAMLPFYFPNIHRLYLQPLDDDVAMHHRLWKPLPKTFESIGNFQSLTEIYLYRSVSLSVDCLIKLANSVERLPSLESFRMIGWKVCLPNHQQGGGSCQQQAEEGLEALFCALAFHPTLQYETHDRSSFISSDIDRRGRIYRPESRFVEPPPDPYVIPDHCWNILLLGKEVKEMKRRGEWPVDHTVGLTVWVQSLINLGTTWPFGRMYYYGIKLDLLFLFLKDFPWDAHLRAPVNIDNQLPAAPIVRGRPSSNSTEQEQEGHEQKKRRIN